MSSRLAQFGPLTIRAELSAELVAASAGFAAGVNLRAALGTALLPDLPFLGWFLGCCFGRFRVAKFCQPGFIGLLHRTLWMDAAE